MNDTVGLILTLTYLSVIFVIGPYLIYRSNKKRVITGTFNTSDGLQIQYIIGDNIGYKRHGICVTLPFELPSVYADAQHSNALAQQSTIDSFTNARQLSLEGNFDNSFQILCTKNNETEILRLLTPDIMIHLTSITNKFDIFIERNQLWLLSDKKVHRTTSENQLLQISLELYELLSTKSKNDFSQLALEPLGYVPIRSYLVFNKYIPKDILIFGIFGFILSGLLWASYFYANEPFIALGIVIVFSLLFFPGMPIIIYTMIHSRNHSFDITYSRYLELRLKFAHSIKKFLNNIFHNT